MLKKTLLLALTLTLGAAGAQDGTPVTTPETTETTVDVGLTGLDHLKRLVDGGATLTISVDGQPVTFEELLAMTITEDMVIVFKINDVPYTLAGSLTDPGMPKVTVDLANGVTQTVAMPAALNRVAHGLHKTRPVAEKPVVAPELPAQATERRPVDTGRSENAGRPTDLPAAAQGRGK